MAKAKPAVVEEVEGGEIEVGSMVRFLGYSEDTPEAERVLEEGVEYSVAELPGEEDGEPTGYILQAANPDFNPKKKVTEANPEFIEVEVFEEEIELVDGEEEAEEAEEEGEEEAEEEGDLTLEEVEGMDKAELLALAKDNDIKLTVAQKKTADTIRAVVVDVLGLGEEEEASEEEEEEAPAPVKAKGKAAAAKPAKEAAPAKGKAAAKEAAPAKGKAAAAAKPAKGAAKATPAKVAPVDEDEMPDLEGEDESVLALIEENSDDLVGLAQSIESEVSASEYRLGGVLYHIKKAKKYLEIEGGEQYDEKGGFQKFLIDHFNIGYRKAQYLIEIYISFTQAGIADAADVVARIGWTKAQKIAAPMMADGADIDGLIDLAEKNAVVDLSEMLKEQIEVGGSKTPGTKVTRLTLKFRYTEEEAQIVEDVLNVAGEKLGTSGEQALFQILSEWAVANNVETAQTAKPVAKVVGKAPAKTAAAKPAAKAAAKPAAKARAKA